LKLSAQIVLEKDINRKRTKDLVNAIILLTTDRNVIDADGEDLSYIKVKIVDQESRICPNADNLMKFKNEGKDIIAGVGNGNPISHEYFKASERKAFHGLCLAVVKSKQERGDIRLSAESEGLQSAKVLIKVK